MTNLTWPQGEDLLLPYIYSEGADINSLVVIDLSTNYSVRMDLVVDGTGERIYTFNSEDLADVDPIASGSQPDTTKEAVLTNGAGGTANINISVPRSLTLPGGAVYAKMTGSPAVNSFKFDIFLRNKGTDKQTRIDQGTVTVDKSYTLWL